MLPACDARQWFGAGYLAHVSSTLVDPILRTVGASLAPHDRVVLAVSGGLDSMALLDAAAATCERSRLVVATYDHGTGSSAKAACALVHRAAEDRGIECVVGRAPPGSIRPLRRVQRMKASGITSVRPRIAISSSPIRR